MRKFLDSDVCYFVTQRSRDHQTVFPQKRDYKFYIHLLKRQKARFGIRIFGFCLIPTAVYFVLQPAGNELLPGFMHSLSRNYASYFTAKYQKDDVLWQRRFNTIPLDNDSDLLDYLKYVEFIPVHQLDYPTPIIYPWSSCSLRVLGTRNGILDTQTFIRDTLYGRLNSRSFLQDTKVSQ